MISWGFSFVQLFVLFVSSCLFLSGCGKSDAPSAGADKLTLQLNWKPEPEFGGFYTAQMDGIYSKHGLNVDVVPGGVGTPTVQMIAAGKVPFGIVSADEVILSRSNGAPVVALFAVYQTNPQGLMTHAARGLTSLEDIFAHDGTVAIQKGLPYSTFLENKYGFGKVKIVPSPGGDLSAFRNDPNFTMQCFVTSEPLAAKRANLDPQTFLIAESGYNPYTAVLATNESFLQSNQKSVKSMVDAVREGWQVYVADPGKTNELMGKLNPAMDAQTFKESAEAQKSLIEAERANGTDIGTMNLTRWQTLVQQLVDLKVIDKPVAAEGCFVDVDKMK
jgi:NitT/TauT family transport system substrate-binding protein